MKLLILAAMVSAAIPNTVDDKLLDEPLEDPRPKMQLQQVQYTEELFNELEREHMKRIQAEALNETLKTVIREQAEENYKLHMQLGRRATLRNVMNTGARLLAPQQTFIPQIVIPPPVPNTMPR